MNNSVYRDNDFGIVLAASFFALRLILLFSLTIEGLQGYGDLVNFFSLASLGSPFIDIWVEFPPIFPWFSRLAFLIGKGQDHLHSYILVVIFTIAQSLTILIFYRISAMTWDESVAQTQSLIYAAVSLVLVYGWWYFDSLAVFFMLLSTLMLARGKPVSGGFSIGFGALIKWFPIFVLPSAWLLRPRREAISITILAIGLVLIVFAAFWITSPDMTLASLQSQWSKSSWQTPWALLDGNYQTGNFGSYQERYDPAQAAIRIGNQAVIPSYLSLPLFLLIGLWSFLRAERANLRAAIAFLGLTWVLFLLWSPGWSPQWSLYLLPLFLIALPLRTALILTANFMLVSLLEWPILLSRGRFDLLWVPVLLRTALLLIAAWEFGQRSVHSHRLTYEQGGVD